MGFYSVATGTKINCSSQLNVWSSFNNKCSRNLVVMRHLTDFLSKNQVTSYDNSDMEEILKSLLLGIILPAFSSPGIDKLLKTLIKLMDRPKAFPNTYYTKNVFLSKGRFLSFFPFFSPTYQTCFLLEPYKNDDTRYIHHMFVLFSTNTASSVFFNIFPRILKKRFRRGFISRPPEVLYHLPERKIILNNSLLKIEKYFSTQTKTKK